LEKGTKSENKVERERKEREGEKGERGLNKCIRPRVTRLDELSPNGRLFSFFVNCMHTEVALTWGYTLYHPKREIIILTKKRFLATFFSQMHLVKVM
jgi:hypothetical protein